MQSLLQNLPVGWRFQPTNEELLHHYLKNKRLGLPVHGFDIQDVKISDFDPGDLIDKNSASKERYLFCRREFHLKTGGTQRKRKAKGGSWNRTGAIVHIKSEEDEDEVIGTKKIFVYHDPNPTEFVIHEFELDHTPYQGDNDFVLCKLMINKKKEKAIKKRKKVGSRSEKKVAINPEEINLDYTSHRMAADTSSRMAADLENQIPNYVNAISLHEISSSWFGNQNSGEMTAVSTHKKVETSSLVNFDFENSNENQTISDWPCKEGEQSYPIALDFGNQNPGEGEITAVSTHKNIDTSSLVNLEFENSNQNQTISDLPYKEGDLSYPIALDFGNQNPSKETNISASIEGRLSLLQETPLDFGKQNQYAKTDMSDLAYFWRSLLDSSDLETNSEEVESRCKKTDTSNLDDLGDTTFPEINSEMLDELTMFGDLLNTLFHEPPEPLN